MKIETKRLLLVNSSVELSEAEINDRKRFAELLNAVVPANWPPPLNDENSMAYNLKQLKANPPGFQWGMWYFLLKMADKRYIAIGNGGFRGAPSPEGVVEIGYSVMENHQKQGYAPEAVKTLVELAFRDPRVKCIIAETLPELRPSIRVLEKLNFRFAGVGSEAGVIRYILQ